LIGVSEAIESSNYSAVEQLLSLVPSQRGQA
jgi:hypothetical protein